MILSLLILFCVLSLAYISVWQYFKYPLSRKKIYGEEMIEAYDQIWKNLKEYDLSDNNQVYNVLQEKKKKIEGVNKVYSNSDIVKSQQNSSSITSQLQKNHIKDSLKQLKDVFVQTYNTQKLPIGTIIPIVYDQNENKGIDYYKSVEQEMLQYGMKIVVLNEDYKARMKNFITNKDGSGEYIGDNSDIVLYREGYFDNAPGVGQIEIDINNGIGRILRQDSKNAYKGQVIGKDSQYQQFKYSQLYQHIDDTATRMDNRKFSSRYISSRYNGIGYNFDKEGVQGYTMIYKRFKEGDAHQVGKDIEQQINTNQIINELVINRDIEKNNTKYYNPADKSQVSKVQLDVDIKYYKGLDYDGIVYYKSPNYTFKFLTLKQPKDKNNRGQGHCFYRCLMNIEQTINTDNLNLNYTSTYDSMLSLMKNIQQQTISDYSQDILDKQTDDQKIYNPNCIEDLVYNQQSIYVEKNYYNFFQFIYNYNSPIKGTFSWDDTCQQLGVYASLQNNSVLQHFINSLLGYNSLYVSSQFDDIVEYLQVGEQMGINIKDINTQIKSLQNELDTNAEIDISYKYIDPLDYNKGIIDIPGKTNNYSYEPNLKNYQYKPDIENEQIVNLCREQNHVCCCYIMIVGYI